MNDFYMGKVKESSRGKKENDITCKLESTQSSGRSVWKISLCKEKDIFLMF